jgi:hypothetical protein
MIDTVFEELVRNKSCIETCNFFRSHAVHHDQQTKDKATRQVNATSQSTTSTSSNKMDKTKQDLKLIKELQIKDLTVLEDEVTSQADIWKSLSLVSKIRRWKRYQVQLLETLQSLLLETPVPQVPIPVFLTNMQKWKMQWKGMTFKTNQQTLLVLVSMTYL